MLEVVLKGIPKFDVSPEIDESLEFFHLMLLFFFAA